MPPQVLSDDEDVDDIMPFRPPVSNVSTPAPAPKKRGRPPKSGSKASTPVVAAPPPVQVDDEEEEDDEEALDPDEFTVEKILTHTLDQYGQIKFHVKWEGYASKDDLTWEPEENLTGTANVILQEYYEKNGGRDKCLGKEDTAGTESPAVDAPPKKKRGRPSMKGSLAVEGQIPNGKKQKTHPAESTPPSSFVNNTFKPPSGSWEEEVTSIDACEGEDGKVQVFLQWQTGHKTQHPLNTVYKRCPQKMLKFYEQHLVFKKGGGSDDA